MLDSIKGLIPSIPSPGIFVPWQVDQEDRAAISGRVEQVETRVDKLSEWHEGVDIKLARLDEKIGWVLFLVAASTVISLGDRIAPSLLPLILKLIGAVP